MIRPLPHIAGMAPYAIANIVPPEGKQVISLSQNESLRAPTPAVPKAVTRAAKNGALYPDPECHQLREAVAGLHGVSPDHLVFGAGTLDLIACITRVYAGPGRAVLAPEHAYPFFQTAAHLANARFDTAAEVALTANVDALLSSVQADTALVCIANPGNPTGTRISTAELRRLRDGLPDDVLLVIDEAYAEFADHLGETVFDLIDGGNTVVLRTFSKAYGLAGFRVGWGAFPSAVAAEMRKALNPNNLSGPAQAAALAAVQDQTYMRETCALTVGLRKEAEVQLLQLNLTPVPSFTNFILIDFETPQAAASADAALRAEGIFLRPQDGAGLPHCVRMTIAPQPAMAAAFDVLTQWKEAT